MGALAAIALTWIKSNWQVVVIAIAVAALIGYIAALRLEVHHYKAKAGELELEISTAKAEQKKETERQQLAFDEITRQHMNSLRARGDSIMKGFNDSLARIKAHEASKHVVLTPDVVELFNATTGPKAEPSTAVPGNVTETGPTKEALTKTLNDLLVVSDENNANHLKCIAQVEEWQDFWEKYVNARAPGHSD